MENLTDLRIFVRVVSSGSLSAAAREMNLSLAVVSKRLAILEERLGCRLVNRTTRRLSITDEGLVLHQRAMRILADVDETMDLLAHGRREPRGLLRVTAPVGFGRRHVAPVALDLSRTYAGLRVDLDLTDRVVDLVEGGFDVAVRLGTLPDSSLIGRKLADNRRVVVAAPAYLAEMGEPGLPTDLVGHRCLLFADNAGIWTFDGPGGPVTQRVSGPLHSNDGEVAHAWALAGGGLVLKSVWDVACDLREGRLRRVLAGWEAGAAPIHAVFPPGRHLSVRVRVFIEAMAARLKEAAAGIGMGP